MLRNEGHYHLPYHGLCARDRLRGPRWLEGKIGCDEFGNTQRRIMGGEDRSGSSSTVVHHRPDGSLSPDSFRARQMLLTAESGQLRTPREDEIMNFNREHTHGRSWSGP